MGHFDTLARLSERYLKELGMMVESSHLFAFDEVPQEILPKAYTEEEIEIMKDLFFLPFRTIAVQDKPGVVIIRDTVKGQRGMSAPREFVDLYTISKETKHAFRDQVDDLDIPDEGLTIITKGRINQVIVGLKSMQVAGELDSLDAFIGDTKVHSEKYKGDAPEEGISGFLRNCKIALEEVFFFNNPTRFVVEIDTIHKRSNNAGRIRRSHERPRYILLRPKEIRETLRLPEPTGSTKAPHERRAHFRHLRSDFYANKKGQTILIPACWIGPSEATVGNRTYKILLDK